MLFETNFKDTRDLDSQNDGAIILMPSSPKGFFLSSNSTKFSLLLKILDIPLIKFTPKLVPENKAFLLKQYVSQYYLNH